MSSAMVVDRHAPPTAMSAEEALLSRRSVRAFLPQPVSRAQVERLLTLASRAANNSNIQPWHVHVLTGEKRRQVTAALLEAFDTVGRVDECEYPYQPKPDQWAEPYRSRRRSFGEALYGDTLGIPADDLERRQAYHRRNYDFFGAPVGMILTVSRHPRSSALVDAGLFLQALMTAARAEGLDTCAQASFIDFYPVLRRELDIPEDHMIVCGLSLGYADPDHRLSTMRTERQPLEEISTFYGDEQD